MARVYSYIRFSTPEQALGTSGVRQAEYAERYALERGLVLDDVLTLRDEGLSAYHQKHVKQGALGAFLRAVDDGLVASGSVLIIEALDRLSRAEPIVAQAQLAQIVNAGITVVTASDGKVYSRESLRSNPMDLVYSILVMIRAHEESDTKARRVTAALRLQCEAWQSGRYRGHIRNGRAPEWLRETGIDYPLFEVVPERVEALLAAIALYRQGYGGGEIARRLNGSGASYTGRPVSGSHFYKIIQRPDLYGCKVVTADGIEYSLDDYYPAVVDHAEWLVLQGERRTRKKAPSSGIPGVITGIGLCYCGYCGASMNGVNYVGKAAGAGVLHEGWRRLICSRHSLTADCAVGSSTMLGPVERAVVDFCRDKIDLGALVDQSAGVADCRARLADIDARLAEVMRHADRLAGALLVTDEAPQIIVKRLQALEDDQLRLERERVGVADELRDLAGRESGGAGLLAEWRRLSAGVSGSLDYDARMMLRDLVAKTFARIDVYVRGVAALTAGAEASVAGVLFSGMAGSGDDVDLVLRFRSGAVRVLRVDSRSGAWRGQLDIDK